MSSDFNHRVKRSALLTLACLCPMATAHALGLGEASVRSNLGQPLHAVVELIDAAPELDADCFRVTAASVTTPSPTDVRLALIRSGGQTRLHIRTPNSVNEPVLQFVVGTECDVRMQREYALLLDPPAEAPAEPAVTPAAAPAPVRSTRPRASDTRVRETPVSASRAVTSAPRNTRPRVAAAAEAAPRLILSGKRYFTGGPESRFALQLDTSLPDLNRAPSTPEPLTPTELSDENTALARKLAHLETQLSELHRRNAELQTRQAARTPPPAPAPTTAARWPLALLLIAIVASGATLVIWLRRRAQIPPPPLAAIPASSIDGELLATPSADRMADDDSHASPSIHARTAQDPPTDPDKESTEVKEDILDQAEVFVAHGHGDFAIHLLQEHVRAAPMESPVPWLLLLDLQHRAGDAEGYATTSTECRRYFNVNLSGHPISQDGNEPGPGLDAYPHLMDRLLAVWNTPEIDAFLNQLVYDDRGGTRMGFEPSAYRDILLLREIALQTQTLAAKPDERAATA